MAASWFERANAAIKLASDKAADTVHTPKVIVSSGTMTTAGTLSAGENHIGQAATPLSFVDVTLSLDTVAYASGDVLADTQVVTNAMRAADGLGILRSIALVDEDDQGVAFDLYFFSANVSLGTENAAPNISDADARNFLGIVAIATTDWKDLGGVRVAYIDDIGMVVKPATGTRNIYVGAVNGAGTPTFTAAGVTLRLGFETN